MGELIPQRPFAVKKNGEGCRCSKLQRLGTFTLGTLVKRSERSIERMSQKLRGKMIIHTGTSATFSGMPMAMKSFSVIYCMKKFTAWHSEKRTPFSKSTFVWNV